MAAIIVEQTQVVDCSTNSVAEVETFSMESMVETVIMNIDPSYIKALVKGHS